VQLNLHQSQLYAAGRESVREGGAQPPQVVAQRDLAGARVVIDLDVRLNVGDRWVVEHEFAGGYLSCVWFTITEHANQTAWKQ
jgi:hypothetical protein